MGFAASFLGIALALTGSASVLAQAGATDTPPPGSGSAYITQTYTEAINVRTGPSTVYYPVIGQLPIGATAPAIAASPSREWIEISYPAGPGGVGWIYAANVALSGSLQIGAGLYPLLGGLTVTLPLVPALLWRYRLRRAATRRPNRAST